jgi:hypothetical protein
MARKDRAPKPPRVQAPQRRSGPAAASADRSRTLMYAVAGSGILLLAVVVALVAFTGGGSGNSTDNVRAAMEKAGCTLKTFPGGKATHLTDFNAKPKWNSNPPTSGPHHQEPAIWGFYTEPVNEVQAVHNLEHGGIVIHWGPDVPQAEIDAIREWYDKDPQGLLAAPYPGIDGKITLGAWNAEPNQDGQGILAECPKFDEQAFDAFVEAYRFKGPERIDPQFLQPGS